MLIRYEAGLPPIARIATKMLFVIIRAIRGKTTLADYITVPLGRDDILDNALELHTKSKDLIPKQSLSRYGLFDLLLSCQRHGKEQSTEYDSGA